MKKKSIIIIRKSKVYPNSKRASNTQPQSYNNNIQKRTNLNINMLSNNKKKKKIYSNKLTNKKFDSVKFNEYLKTLNEYENKKKKKLENLRKQEAEKELRKITNFPKINKSTKYAIKPNQKNYSTIERLYTQDIIKRKEKKQILTKIYTPSFKPYIYANNFLKGKLNQRNQNIRTEINEDENNYLFEDDEDTNDEISEEENKRRNKSVEKRIRDRIEDDDDIVYDNKKIENKLRNFLFKNKNKNRNSIKKNQSVDKRKKSKFNFD